MTTPLDRKMLPKVKSLLDKVGKTVTLKWQHDTSYDPDTDQVTAVAETESTIKVTPPSPYASTMIDGDLIQRGDTRVFAAGQGFPVDDIDQLEPDRLTMTIDSRVWQVIEVAAHYSGDSVVLWEFQLRR